VPGAFAIVKVVPIVLFAAPKDVKLVVPTVRILYDSPFTIAVAAVPMVPVPPEPVGAASDVTVIVSVTVPIVSVAV
jgi:hypothetical protein